ncbi:MAG: hypothetical protein H7330_10650, partial [Hymenobacteraceae bacterium]|nr:hypothetical protein [Hymenobacteraceae bacterium]
MTTLAAFVCLLPLLVGALLLLTGERLRRVAGALAITGTTSALGLASYVAAQTWGQAGFGTEWTWFRIGGT